MGFCARSLGWGGWGHMGGWSGLGWLGPLFGLVLLAGLIGLVVLGALWMARSGDQRPATAGPTHSEPLAIAQRRLAAGEISRAEFEDLRNTLKQLE